MLQIMLIIRVVHDTLQVALIIAHLVLQLKNIICHIPYFFCKGSESRTQYKIKEILIPKNIEKNEKYESLFLIQKLVYSRFFSYLCKKNHAEKSKRFSSKEKTKQGFCRPPPHIRADARRCTGARPYLCVRPPVTSETLSPSLFSPVSSPVRCRFFPLSLVRKNLRSNEGKSFP